MFLICLSALAFVGLTIEKPRTGAILQQFDDIKGRTGQNLPFKLVSDDAEHELGEYAGRVILINIWATWCTPCLKEMSELSRLQKEYGDGLTVIALSDESKETVLEYARQYPFEFLYGYVDVLEWAGADLGTARPVTFLIDREGVVQDYFTGACSYEFFESRLKPLLFD